MTRFAALFGGPPRQPESPITQREMDIAASIQEVLNRIVLRMAEFVRHETGMKHLVMAGGVALNVVSTGLLSRTGLFDEIWIQPAAGDAGSALGAALWMWHMVLGHPRTARAARWHARVVPRSRHCGGVRTQDDQLLRELNAVWHTYSDADLQRARGGADR